MCKLLLRPLDDRYSASRGSTQNIRGYSRQSESYVSSLSNSADNSANDVDDEDFNFEGHFNASQLFKYQRPGSRALSVPAPICYGYGKILLPTIYFYCKMVNSGYPSYLLNLDTESPGHRQLRNHVGLVFGHLRRNW